MSLVYEALRKAEREKERKAGPPLSPASAPPSAPQTTVAAPVLPPTPAPRRGARNDLSALILGVSLVAVAALAYVIVVVTKSIPAPRAEEAGTRPAAAATPAAAPAAPAPGPPAPAPAAPATANDPRFHLTGIMGWPDGGFGAVINGKNVREGYYVDGAIVKKIERDRVTLNVDGVEVVLRLY
jgi:hypothetical protein